MGKGKKESQDDSERVRSPYAKYSKDFPAIILRKAEEDDSFWATTTQVANVLGCSHTTVDNWRKNHPEFEMAIAQAREIANDRLEAAVYERASGKAQTKTVKIIDRPDGTRVTERVATTHAPDVSLAKFILINRRPREWRDKQFELNLTNKVIVKAEDLTDDELADIIRRSGE